MSFPKQVFITGGSICAISAYPLMTYGNADMLRAAVAGGVIATLNILAGYAAIRRSANRSMNTFLKVVFGGMGLRLLVLAGVLAGLIGLFGFHAGALVASLGVFYLTYLVLEIVYIQKTLGTRQDG